MATDFEIAVFSGDGIGPEITVPTVKILERLTDAATGYDLVFTDAPAGAELYAATGEPFPAASMETARSCACATDGATTSSAPMTA